MKKTKTLIVILLVFLYMKCSYGLFYLRMTHLTENEREWVRKPYDGDIYFYSPEGNRAKAYMLSKSLDYQNPFYFSANTRDYHEAIAGYNSVVFAENLRFDASVYIVRRINNDSLIFGCQVNNFMSYKMTLENHVSTQLINGKRYDNCLCIDTTNAYYNDENQPEEERIDKFIISKDYGLMYFRFKNGREYFRKR